MFKHILIPSDGSELANKAVAAAVEFAREAGAKVTGYSAIHEPHFRHSHYEGIDNTIRTELERRARAAAEDCLATVRDAARAAGVEYQAHITIADSPYRGIIAAANDCGCDVVFMASHGRSGLPGLFMGSVTQGVLTHSRIPVLVFR